MYWAKYWLLIGLSQSQRPGAEGCEVRSVAAGRLQLRLVAAGAELAVASPFRLGRPARLEQHRQAAGQRPTCGRAPAITKSSIVIIK